MPDLLLSATTASGQPNLAGWSTVAVIAFIVWRVALIVLFPFGPCGHCNGAARFKHGKYWRPCRRCKGSGRKARFGRQVWDWLTKAHVNK